MTAVNRTRRTTVPRPPKKTHPGRRPARQREAHEARRARAAAIFSRLERAYPDARCALDHGDPYQLIVATILSAQCTDARVNLVTPEVFRRYPTPAALATARQSQLEGVIRSTGFFRNKSRSLIAMAQALVADHGGIVPHTMKELHALPGVGRKTANVVLGNAFGINEGVTVDTHVARLSKLLGLSRETDPIKIERDLMALVSRDDWALLSHLLIFHGRQICIARRPKCGECVLADLCPSAKLED